MLSSSKTTLLFLCLACPLVLGSTDSKDLAGFSDPPDFATQLFHVVVNLLYSMMTIVSDVGLLKTLEYLGLACGIILIFFETVSLISLSPIFVVGGYILVFVGYAIGHVYNRGYLTKLDAFHRALHFFSFMFFVTHPPYFVALKYDYMEEGCIGFAVVAIALAVVLFQSRIFGPLSALSGVYSSLGIYRIATNDRYLYKTHKWFEVPWKLFHFAILPLWISIMLIASLLNRTKALQQVSGQTAIDTRRK